VLWHTRPGSPHEPFPGGFLPPTLSPVPGPGAELEDAAGPAPCHHELSWGLRGGHRGAQPGPAPQLSCPWPAVPPQDARGRRYPLGITSAAPGRWHSGTGSQRHHRWSHGLARGVHSHRTPLGLAQGPKVGRGATSLLCSRESVGPK